MQNFARRCSQLPVTSTLPARPDVETIEAAAVFCPNIHSLVFLQLANNREREREWGWPNVVVGTREKNVPDPTCTRIRILIYTEPTCTVYNVNIVYSVRIPIRPPGHRRCRPNGTITAVGQICPMAGTSRLLSVDKYIKTQTQYPASAQRVPGVSATRPSESSQDCDCSHLQIQV